jgi:hypothetical protein
MSGYVYIPKRPGDPATVGFYKPDGEWVPESDHVTDEQAADRVRWLNGGNETGLQRAIEECFESLERTIRVS